MAAGEDGGEGHPFAADDHGPLEGLEMLEIDIGLQRAGRHHAARAGAADEARRARRFARAGGEDDAVRRDLADAVGVLHAQHVAIDAEHGVAGADIEVRRVVRAAARRSAGRSRCGGGSASRSPGARNGAGCRLPRCSRSSTVAATAELTEPPRGGEPRRAAADDDDVTPFHGVFSRNSASTWAEQLKPWQRPIMARVRRLRPPRSPAGSGPSRAASISPRVTHSQWQTISPPCM